MAERGEKRSRRAKVEGRIKKVNKAKTKQSYGKEYAKVEGKNKSHSNT